MKAGDRRSYCHKKKKKSAVLWTCPNPSVSRYEWKNTLKRCNNKECLCWSLAQSREQLGVYFFFCLQRSFHGDRRPLSCFRHTCSAARTDVGVWKELLFNLWTLPSTLLQSVKWQRKKWLDVWRRENAGEWESDGKPAVNLMLVSCAGRNVIAVWHFKPSMSKGAMLLGSLCLFENAQGRITYKIKLT